MTLPCPTFSIDISLPGGGGDIEPDMSTLPNRPGVFAFENEAGQTICLAVTANLRRLVKSRLAPIESEDENKPSRRIDYHKLAKRVKALPVASSFEADWAYLQFAREFVPHAAKSLTDRWRGWFVHVNPETQFPRFVKTSTPGKPPTGENGVYLGPINDKHAAARFMDALAAGFDLCRYYHVLIEAPNGRACAYKEMGRCPAPCDGTVTMSHYHEQIRAAVQFASNRAQWRNDCEQRMNEHATAMEFEAAELCKRQSSDLEPAMKPAFKYVDRLERFQWLAITPGERDGWARVIVINGGWIAPIADLRLDTTDSGISDVASAIDQCIRSWTIEMSDAEIENIGLVCTHFFHPRSRKKKQPPIVFVKVADGCDVRSLCDAINAMDHTLRNPDESEDRDDGDVSEQAIEMN